MFDELIEFVKINISKKLAGQVADRDTPAAKKLFWLGQKLSLSLSLSLSVPHRKDQAGR